MAKTGRRTKAEELGIVQQLADNPLPPMGDTPAQIQAYLEAVGERVGAGQMDSRTCDALTKLAGTKIRAMRLDIETTREQRSEEMLRRAEALQLAGKRHESAQRKNRKVAAQESAEEASPPSDPMKGDLPPVPATRVH